MALEEKQLRVMELYSDFRLANYFATGGEDIIPRDDEFWTKRVLAGYSIGMVLYDAVYLAAGYSAQGVVINYNSRIVAQHAGRQSSVEEAWIDVLTHMKLRHHNLSRSMRQQDVAPSIAWSVVVKTISVVENITRILPEVQAYYAFRLAHDFGIRIVAIGLKAREILERVPADSDLYLEDAEERRKLVTTVISRFLRTRPAVLVVGFAVPIAANAFFIQELTD